MNLFTFFRGDTTESALLDSITRNHQKIGASEVGRAILRRISPLIDRYKFQPAETQVLHDVVEIIDQEVAKAVNR